MATNLIAELETALVCRDFCEEEEIPCSNSFTNPDICQKSIIVEGEEICCLVFPGSRRETFCSDQCITDYMDTIYLTVKKPDRS